MNLVVYPLTNGASAVISSAALLTTMRKRVLTMADCEVQKKHYVYKITCRTTGQSYIGRTTRKDQRFAEHRNFSTAKKLNAAINLYGIENFSYEVLCECSTPKSAQETERAFIKSYGTRWPSGFNVSGAGKGALASVTSAEGKERRAAAQRRLWDNPNHRKIVSERVRVFWSRPENKEILRQRMLARWQDSEFRARQEAAHWSRKHSAETREKIRRIALAREAEKRALGIKPETAHLAEGNKKAWSDKDKRAARLKATAKFWESDAGVALKQKLRAKTQQMNEARASNPLVMAEISRKISVAKTGTVMSQEAKDRMSRAAKARHARNKTVPLSGTEEDECRST